MSRGDDELAAKELLDVTLLETLKLITILTFLQNTKYSAKRDAGKIIGIVLFHLEISDPPQ